MKQKLFNKNKYPKRCDSCFYGRLDAQGDKVLCTKNGIMMPSHICKSYKYDALKRTPERNKQIAKFSSEDFKF